MAPEVWFLCAFVLIVLMVLVLLALCVRTNDERRKKHMLRQVEIGQLTLATTNVTENARRRTLKHFVLPPKVVSPSAHDLQIDGSTWKLEYETLAQHMRDTKPLATGYATTVQTSNVRIRQAAAAAATPRADGPENLVLQFDLPTKLTGMNISSPDIVWTGKSYAADVGGVNGPIGYITRQPLLAASNVSGQMQVTVEFDFGSVGVPVEATELVCEFRLVFLYEFT